MLKDTKSHSIKQHPPAHVAEIVRLELASMAEDTDPPAAPTGHRTQQRRGEDAASSEDDSDPLPTKRQLYDRLLAAANSGHFPFFCTFRTPRPAPQTARYNPKHQEHLGNEIARSLAALGVAAIVCGSFQSINTQKQNPHFHALLSARPPYAWSKAFREEFGRRAVHVQEIGPKPQDAAKVSYYVSRQTVSVSTASPAGFARSALLEDATEEGRASFTTGAVVFPAPLGNGSPRWPSAHPKGRTSKAGSIGLATSTTTTTRHRCRESGPQRPDVHNAHCLSNRRHTDINHKQTTHHPKTTPVDCVTQQVRLSMPACDAGPSPMPVKWP